MPTIYRIIIGCVLITIVALVSDRSRAAAGILATAPINIPIILWVLWGNTGGDHAGMATVSRSMLIGLASTACFTAVCWWGFRQRWSFGQILAMGYTAWALVVWGPLLLRRVIERLS
jgi:hypothetical protein